MATTFTYELTNDQQELLLGLMVNGNYRKREVPYSVYSIEGDHFNATLYSKEKHGLRKLCVQGSKAEDFVLFQLEPLVLGKAALGYEKELQPELFSAHAGSDESGKGDYFGPLVVCCAYVDEAIVEGMKKFTYLDSQNRVRKLEVRDCKQMTDAQVLMAGESLRKLLSDEMRVVGVVRTVQQVGSEIDGEAVDAEIVGDQIRFPDAVSSEFSQPKRASTRLWASRGSSGAPALALPRTANFSAIELARTSGSAV